MRTAHKAALAAAGLVASLCIPTAQARAVGAADPAAAPTALARHYDQRPAWHRCGTGTGPRDPAGFQCADVEVPVDYARGGGLSDGGPVADAGCGVPSPGSEGKP